VKKQWVNPIRKFSNGMNATCEILLMWFTLVSSYKRKKTAELMTPPVKTFIIKPDNDEIAHLISIETGDHNNVWEIAIHKTVF
jgi:hypothetical protein